MRQGRYADFAFGPIFYVLFLLTAVFGYNTSIKLGRKNQWKKAGVIIDDEIDSTPATYIRATENSRYPDISLLVVGEPMTKTQVHLSIFILAISDDSTDCNDKLLKRIVAVKEKHNPRLDTYVETFKSIITDRLNKWIIQVNGTQDIY